MVFPFLKKKEEKKKKTKYFISLDIGTEVLKGLVFSISDLGVDVWFSYHVKQQKKAMRSGMILEENVVIENSELVIYKLLERLDEESRPDTMVLGLAGELINGISITVDYDRSELADQKIDKDEANYIIEKVFDQVITSSKPELASRLMVPEEEVTILHVSITGFMVDNKMVADIIGESPKNVRLFLYASFAPKKQVDKLFNIASSLGINIGAIVVQPYAVARAYAGASEPGFSGIFVDIGGGTTDVALVEDGNKLQTQMYAFGGRAFTNRIAKEFNLPYNLAEERKVKYSLGELPLQVRDRLRDVLVPDVKLWVESLKVALEQMEDVKSFPEMFYLCGGGALLPDIKEMMLTYPWHKELPFRRMPKMTLITPDRLDKVYDKSGLLVNPYDVTPAALARFYWDVMYRPYYHTVLSGVVE